VPKVLISAIAGFAKVHSVGVQCARSPPIAEFAYKRWCLTTGTVGDAIEARCFVRTCGGVPSSPEGVQRINYTRVTSILYGAAALTQHSVVFRLITGVADLEVFGDGSVA